MPASGFVIVVVGSRFGFGSAPGLDAGFGRVLDVAGFRGGSGRARASRWVLRSLRT